MRASRAVVLDQNQRLTHGRVEDRLWVFGIWIAQLERLEIAGVAVGKFVTKDNFLSHRACEHHDDHDGRLYTNKFDGISFSEARRRREVHGRAFWFRVEPHFVYVQAQDGADDGVSCLMNGLVAS